MGKAVVIQLVLGILIGGGLGALLGHLGKCSTGTCPLTANPWRGGMYGMIAGAVFALAVPTSRPGADTLSPGGATDAAETGSAANSVVQHVVSTVDFEDQVLQAELPVLVDFYSDSCPPCRMLGPTIEKLATSYAGRALVCKVNVNRLPQLAARYGIRGIPAVLFFLTGDEKDRLVGLRSEEAYASVLDKLTK
jgi:thioredoxin